MFHITDVGAEGSLLLVVVLIMTCVVSYIRIVVRNHVEEIQEEQGTRLITPGNALDSPET